MLLGDTGSVVASVRHMGGGFAPHAEGHPMMGGTMLMTREVRLGFCSARHKALQKDESHNYDFRKYRIEPSGSWPQSSG